MSKLPRLEFYYRNLALLLFLYLTVHQVLFYIWGNHGIVDRKKLLETEKLLQEHTEELLNTQQKLQILNETISSDSSFIAIQARNLGYYEPEDQLILINTWEKKLMVPLPGTLLLPSPPEKRSTEALSVYAGIFTMILWLLINISIDKHKISPQQISSQRPLQEKPEASLAVRKEQGRLMRDPPGRLTGL